MQLRRGFDCNWLDLTTFVQIVEQRLPGIFPIRLGQLLQFSEQCLGARIVAGLGQSVEVLRSELAQRLDVTGQQVVALVVVGVAPLLDPADHQVLIISQITHHPEVVVDQQKQRVVLIRSAHPPEKFADMRLAKTSRVFPQIRFAFVLGRIADLHRRHTRGVRLGQRCRCAGHFRQPL
ncbi:hypothetical protein, partial [Pseudomonas atacamensis]|uniref:hypothetical protein n=1 Tax=Pseudomonas atacamensis TaxID=2565368 RepID=UPI0035D10B6C